MRRAPLGSPEDLLRHEWLVTNGLGGYASGTVAGLLTRRYHGLLIAALPAPYGRTVMLSQLADYLRLADGRVVTLCGEESLGNLTDFRLEWGLPVWRFAIEGMEVEKRLAMPHLQNTVHVVYRLLTGHERVRLVLRPWIGIRGHEEPVDSGMQDGRYVLSATGDHYEIRGPGGSPRLRMHLDGQRADMTLDGGGCAELHYAIEAERGYPARGSLWSPGAFAADLGPGAPVALAASTEPWHAMLSLAADEAMPYEIERRRRLITAAHPALREGAAAELVLAADAFVINPYTRTADAIRAHSAGDDVRTVIAGYHWFTDWGRDTMISLEGLTLVTGRQAEAGWILRTFAHYIRDGLIPNMFPEGKSEGLYHTADATLWFFHALGRYLDATGDRETLRQILPQLLDIIAHHRHGTRFGIGVDPADGLLRQGQEGYQLTWMDAKVEDWVVTPRRGKAVEINALWYNALRLMETWLGEEGRAAEAEAMARDAERVHASFNRRFWCESCGHLYDVIDGENGDDDACRPNQIFAIALPHAVLDQRYWRPVAEIVRDRLLTPVGLRSLAPGHPDYKAKYFGNLRARDAAYHQGTVWGWLIGPFIDAWLKLHPEDKDGARHMLDGFLPHLDEAGLGTISEIFDGDAPFHPRGCIAQAWSIAEWLRCRVKTEGWAPD